MNDHMESNGKILEPGVLQFRRLLNGSPEKVWAYLTESEKRGKWLATGEMDLREGGAVTLNFLHRDLSPIPGPPPEKYRDMESGTGFTGKILKVDPPRLLSFTWEGTSEVTFELEPLDNKVLLTLTHRLLPTDKDTLTGVSGGWHTHLDILIANLQGKTPPNFWRLFCELEERYSAIYDPSGETGMLIRRPVAETFEAFVNPDITTKFWFTGSTGRLEKGKEVVWTWEMYNVTSIVHVKELVLNSVIAIDWGAGGGDRTQAQWTFTPMGDQSTFVNIVVSGFKGDEARLLKDITGSVGGFCWVLAGLKAWLEFGIQLNLVGDRFPKGKS
jgi:uncharacterized protein YndB with AHSA1/START domain